ncbi:MAG: CDP-alcohol phosphatidyltransferase family protein [Myxococcota bacterium]
MIATLPNLLTASRGLAGPGIFVLVVVGGLDELAFAVFLIAIVTDLIDGWLARFLGATSDLGTILDPLADKLLIGGTWLTLGVMGWVPWWLAGAMLLRDGLVVFGWLLSRSRAHKPHLAGRLMVSVEGVALPILLFRNEWMQVHWPSVGLLLGLISLLLGAISGGVYVMRLLRRDDSTAPTPVLRA